MKSWPGCLYMLNQSHEKHPQRSSTHRLNTVIKNCGMQFSAEHRRQIIPLELLISQGFPVYAELVAASCGILNDGTGTDMFPSLCSFNLSRSSRKRSAVGGQGGNTVNVALMGVSATWAFGCVERQKKIFFPSFCELTRSSNGPGPWSIILSKLPTALRRWSEIEEKAAAKH